MGYDLHLADRVRSILERAGEFSERRMFGGVAFMVNGHMCCGIVKTDLVLRLTPEQVPVSLHEAHTRPMDFTGKPLKSMIYVSTGGTDSDEALTGWVEAALKVARSLPAETVVHRNGRKRRRAD
jgi:TfoX/Sxy family transcriptional regulator of competence genes